MTLLQIPHNTPSFVALSTDIVGGYFTGTDIPGSLIYLTDTKTWKIVTADLSCADYVIPVSGTGGTGDVVGPSSAVNGHLAVFDTTSGKLIKDGGAVPTSGNTTSSGAYASIPAAGNSGNTYFPTDGLSIYRDNGSNWIPFGPIWPLTKPDITGFGWENQVDATLDTSKGIWTFTDPSNAGADLHWYTRNIPTAPWTMTALIGASPKANINMFGIGMKNSSDGKNSFIAQLYYSSLGAVSLYVGYSTSYSLAGEVTYFGPSNQGQPNFIWFQIVDDNTNWNYNYSLDGISFKNIYQQPRNTNFTPDKIGIFIASRGGGIHYGSILSLKVE